MQPDGAWHQQVAKLEDIWPEIQKLYRSKIVTAVSPGPRYLLPRTSIVGSECLRLDAEDFHCLHDR